MFQSKYKIHKVGWLATLIVTLLLGCIASLAQLRSGKTEIETDANYNSDAKKVLPNTAPGEAMKAFLSRYNSGKLTEPRWARWYTLYGPVEVRSIERSEPNRIAVWAVGTLTKGWINFDLSISPSVTVTEPQIGVVVLGGAPPKHLDSVVVFPSTREKVQEIERYLNALAKADFFSGVVLIAENGNVFFEKAYGFASIPYKSPNRLDTKFNLASLSKIFTSVGIARLAQRGKLSYSDTVDKYLPDYPVAEIRKATIHQLLTHTSGIGRASSDWIADRTLRSLDALIGTTVAKPEFKPGEQSRYNNEAWLLLGKIIEISSGNSFEEFLNHEIFAPTGMKNSGFFRWDAELSNTATPYTFLRFTDNGQLFEPGTRHSAVQMHGIKGSPAGGAFSTAPDLLLFAQRILDHTLLDGIQTDLMMRAHAPGGPDRAFGYGVEVYREGKIVGKGGGSQGVSTSLLLDPARKRVMIVLSNYDAIGQLVSNHLLRILGD